MSSHEFRAFILVGARCSTPPADGAGSLEGPTNAKMLGKSLRPQFVKSGTALALDGGVHGRRNHPRFSVADSDGVLSVLREVAVRWAPTGELVVIDREPRQIGEMLTIESVVNGAEVSTLVRVVGSRADIRNGNVYYELRLLPVTQDAGNEGTR